MFHNKWCQFPENLTKNSNSRIILSNSPLTQARLLIYKIVGRYPWVCVKVLTGFFLGPFSGMTVFHITSVIHILLRPELPIEYTFFRSKRSIYLCGFITRSSWLCVDANGRRPGALFSSTYYVPSSFTLLCFTQQAFRRLGVFLLNIQFIQENTGSHKHQQQFALAFSIEKE